MKWNEPGRRVVGGLTQPNSGQRSISVVSTLSRSAKRKKPEGPVPLCGLCWTKSVGKGACPAPAGWTTSTPAPP